MCEGGGGHNTARRRRGRRAGRGKRLGLTRDCPTHFVAGDSDRGLVTSAVRRAPRARARTRTAIRGVPGGPRRGHGGARHPRDVRGGAACAA